MHVNLEYYLNGNLKETIWDKPIGVARKIKKDLSRTTHKKGKFKIIKR